MSKIVFLLLLLSGCVSDKPGAMMGDSTSWFGGAAVAIAAVTLEMFFYVWPFVFQVILLVMLYKIYRELRAGILAQDLLKVLREVRYANAKRN